MKMRMKILISLGVLISILIIGSCLGKSKEVGIANLKWGMTDAEIQATVKDPDAVYLFGEQGTLKTATGKNGLYVVQFIKYSNNNNIKSEYRDFLDLYFKFKDRYGDATKTELYNPEDEQIYHVITDLNHTLYAQWELSDVTIRLDFKMYAGADVPFIKVLYHRE